MFGISFLEFIIIIACAVVVIKPSEYHDILKFINNIYHYMRRICQVCMEEIETLRSEADIENINKKLENDITEAEEQVKQIVGDDGKIYESYDISEFTKRVH